MNSMPRMKSVDLNEPVPITLPAHIWVGYLAAYKATEWGTTEASCIAMAIQEAVMDPVWLKEQEAAYQESKDQHEAVLGMFQGRRPDFPPTMDDQPQ